MVLSTDEIKQEKNIDMDVNPQPCSSAASAPEDLSMRATGVGKATEGGVVVADRTADDDKRQQQDPNNSRKLTNFFIDDILRSDFGPKRCCSAGITPIPSPVLSPLVRPLPLHFASPVLSFSSLLAHSVTFTPTPTKLRRTDILTPPPSSPESSSSSSPRSSSSLSTVSSTSTPLSRRLQQSPKKESQSSSGPAQDSGSKSTSPATQSSNPSSPGQLPQLPLPAWVYCTRYSDRPSSGPRFRKPRQGSKASTDKRPRTAFSSSQLQRLRTEFQDCPYLSEARRLALARELGLSESQVKIWFQNKRAKLKKGCGMRNPLAQLLMEEGLYNHSTIVVRDDNDDSMHHGDQINSDKN